MGYIGPTQVSPPSGEAALWEYGFVPSLALGIIGIITYISVAMPHLWWFVQMLGVRSVHGLLFFASIIEALGYGARLYSHDHPYGGMAFLIGIYLVQIATILITAALYKSIQRVLKYTPGGRHLSPMRPRSLVTLFVILDVVWVVIQIAGQYFAAGAKSAEITGDDPMFAIGTSGLMFLAGNVLQAITILIVSVFVLVILRRSNRLLATADPSVQYPHIKPLLSQILMSFALFFIRLIVRIAEGSQGLYEYASLHEWVFAIFEYVPLLLILILWAARPLQKFIFPLGHRHGQGAHTRDDVAVAELAVSTTTAAPSPETKA